jgi:hypothetical protein
MGDSRESSTLLVFSKRLPVTLWIEDGSQVFQYNAVAFCQEIPCLPESIQGCALKRGENGVARVEVIQLEKTFRHTDEVAHHFRSMPWNLKK